MGFTYKIIAKSNNTLTELILDNVNVTFRVNKNITINNAQNQAPTSPASEGIRFHMVNIESFTEDNPLNRIYNFLKDFSSSDEYQIEILQGEEYFIIHPFSIIYNMDLILNNGDRADDAGDLFSELSIY